MAQDLLYCELPPRLQILHFMKASTFGGESLFSDTFHALKKMESEDRLLEPLSRFPVTYQYRNDGQWYRFTRRTIEYNTIKALHRDDQMCLKRGQSEHNVTAVNWSPPFQAPFVGAMDVTKRRTGEINSNLWTYLEAAKVFKGLIEDKDAVFERKIDPGTCVIFDNRRIVHARKEFDGQEGERWLRGTYVDEDAFKSRLRVLNEEFGAHYAL